MKGIIEVDLSRGCTNCPLADAEEEFCNAMRNRENYREEYQVNYREVPLWCPLRKGKIICDEKLWEGEN